MSRVWAFLVFFVGFVKLEVVKIGIINDIHYEPYYQSGAPVSNNCRGVTPFEIINYLEAQTTPFGTHGCDAPLRLINLVLNKINEVDPDIEVLLVSGDFVSHGYSVEIGMSDHYFVLKEIIEYVFIEILAKKFPNAVQTINIIINNYYLSFFKLEYKHYIMHNKINYFLGSLSQIVFL